MNTKPIVAFLASVTARVGRTADFAKIDANGDDVIDPREAMTVKAMTVK